MNPTNADYNVGLARPKVLPKTDLIVLPVSPMATFLAVRFGHVHRSVRASHHRDVKGDRVGDSRTRCWCWRIVSEYDGRDVPDVATVAADFPEGVRLVNASMCCEETRIQQLIRGHYGSFVFGNGELMDLTAPERPQVTRISGQQKERIATTSVKDTTMRISKTGSTACHAGEPSLCNNPPDLGAAAIAVVTLGARSYREGSCFFFDADKGEISTRIPVGPRVGRA
ncbi:MAG: hypothetical protein R3C05_04870 [Pirellulaceae bacterium]